MTVVTPGSALTLIDPNSGRQGQSLSVRIVGLTTNFSQAVSQVSFGDGITVNSVTVTNATTLTAVISITRDAVLGLSHREQSPPAPRLPLCPTALLFCLPDKRSP